MDASALLVSSRVSPLEDTNTMDPSRVRKSSYTFHGTERRLNSHTTV